MTPEELLREQNIYYIFQGKDLVVSCLSPEHEDSNPSMRVDKITGVFNCLSCGYSGNLYTKYQIARDIQLELLGKIREQLSNIITSTSGLSLPEGSIPYNRATFRNVPKTTLQEYEAFTNDTVFPDRIVFPIKDAVGRTVAFTGRNLYSNLPPKYKNYPAGVKLPLYPAIIKPRENSIILVEGLFDYINLRFNGARNAVCMFGTRKLSERNIQQKLSAYRMQGVQKLHIMFDGDAAGNTAAKSLQYLVEQHTDFVTNIIKLEEGDDPGSLTPQQIQQYNTQIYKAVA